MVCLLGQVSDIDQVIKKAENDQNLRRDIIAKKDL